MCSCLSAAVIRGEACFTAAPQPPWDLAELGFTAGPGVPQDLVVLQEAKLDQELLQLESFSKIQGVPTKEHLDMTSLYMGPETASGLGEGKRHLDIAF